MRQIGGHERHANAMPLGSRRISMSFVVGCILFVVVVGRLDARLPWPSAGAASKRGAS
jgi:hypothetical protein